MQQRKQRIVLKDFQFKVGELIIEQETNEAEVSIPDTALKAIGQVISAPQQLLGIETNGSVVPGGPPSTPVSGPMELSKPKPRRRRRTALKSGDPEISGGSNGTSPDSIRGRVLELKQSGFFKQERDAAQVVAKLHQQGHTTANKNTVSMALLGLTREENTEKKIYRRKDPHKKWQYRDRPYDHD